MLLIQYISYQGCLVMSAEMTTGHVLYPTPPISMCAFQNNVAHHNGSCVKTATEAVVLTAKTWGDSSMKQQMTECKNSSWLHYTARKRRKLCEECEHIFGRREKQGRNCVWMSFYILTYLTSYCLYLIKQTWKLISSRPPVGLLGWTCCVIHSCVCMKLHLCKKGRELSRSYTS